ncbi:MAG TPA: hypothetical protein VEK36_00625 [Candidatus Paceibacterota bacterium]|nr:hypothetical protein [Candidatus Paceibacterota bacterium]
MNVKRLSQLIPKRFFVFAAMFLPNPADITGSIIGNLYQDTLRGMPNSANVARPLITDLYGSAVGDIVSIFKLPEFWNGRKSLTAHQQAFVSQFFPRVENLIIFLKFLALFLIIAGAIVIINIIIRRRKIFLPGPSIIEQVSQLKPAFMGAMSVRWHEVLQHMDSAKEAEWRIAIIEADKLLEEVLRQSGYTGDTLGERLMNMPEGQLESFERLWEAHKVRNWLVHDVDYFLRYSEAKRVINSYEQALRELKAV